MTASKPPLGQLLVNAGLVEQAALDEVLAAQRKAGDRRRLGELLIDRGLVSPQQLAQLLSFQLACPWVSLTNVVLTPPLVALVPRELALKHTVVPVHLRNLPTGAVLYVAIADPTDESALAEIAEVAGMPVRPMVAATRDIRAAIAGAYALSGRPTAPPPETYPSDIAAAEDEREPITKPGQPRMKPPLPQRGAPGSSPPPSEEPAEIDLEVDVVSETPAVPEAKEKALVVLVVSAPDAFTSACRDAAHTVGAHVEIADLMNLSGLAAAYEPLAIVLTEDLYAFDRHGLNGLALDCDALLVVWGEDLEARQLVPLLEGARARRER